MTIGGLQQQAQGVWCTATLRTSLADGHAALAHVVPQRLTLHVFEEAYMSP